MNESIYELIRANHNIEEDKKESVSKERTLLLFSIQSGIYAVPSTSVRELLREVDVYPLPFVPPYIDGVLNRYGEPYVVIDPSMLLNNEAQDASLFLVFNDDNKMCIRISDVYDFYTVPNEDIKFFLDKDKKVLFKGTFKYNDSEVPIIDQNAVLEKVEKDFEKI